MDSEKQQYIRKIQDDLENLSSVPAASPSRTFSKNPLKSLGCEIWKDISTVKGDMKDPCKLAGKCEFFQARWSVWESFLSSECEKSDLKNDNSKRKELRTKLQQKLRGITIRASVSETEQFKGSVCVEHGKVVAIYGSRDEWVGYILCKSRVLKFSAQHFKSDLPLPLRCDDEVSFLLQTKDLSTILPGSVRVTEYHSKIGPEAVEVAELFLKKANNELILCNKQASALFAQLLSETDVLRIQSPQFIERVLEVVVSSIAIRFPIGSEEERDTNSVFVPFGLNQLGYINPMEQKRFLSFFKGSQEYLGHLVEFCEYKVCNSKEDDYEEVANILVKALFLLIALLKEFPESGSNVGEYANRICKKLASFMDNYELALTLMSLIVSVLSAPPPVESWRSIPALLTVQEFHRRVRNRDGMPPVAEVKATYKDLEEYFDTYYKLLREDAYRGLCRSVRRYLGLHEEKLNEKNDAIYLIRFLEVVPYKMGRFNLCRVEWEPKTDAVKQEGGENSLYLHEGNLFCISASGEFDPEATGDVLFAVKVSEHSSKRVQGRSRGILLKFLPADCNGISEVEAIEKLASTRYSDKAVIMVESPVFYRAYEPVLSALKAMDTQDFPFKSEVLNLHERRLDEAYLPKLEQVVDIGPFQSVDITSAKNNMCCASRVHEELKAYSILDETQAEAVNLVLKQRLAIIQGPPGTGKTFLTSRIIQSLLNVQKPQTPIVVMAYKNRVLDQLVSMCTTFCGDGEIIRLGRLSEDYQQDKRLQACLMPQKGNTDVEVQCLQKSVAGMWKVWEGSLMLKPDQFTLTSCLEHIKSEDLQDFFPDLDVKELMKDMNGPLRDKAEAVFEARKRQWLRAQHQKDTQKSNTRICPGNVEPEDKDKEMDRICDTEDAVNDFSSDDEEVGEIPIEETAPDYLEVKDEGSMDVDFSQDPNQKDVASFNRLAQKQRERAKARLIDALTRIEEVMQEAERVRFIERLKLLKKAKVVAMTITKASIDHKLLHRLQPEMIVIEEAGGILESNVIACLTPNTKHLVMVGDYKQIGPTVASQELKYKKGTHDLKNFSASLMERLVEPNSVETGQAMPKYEFVCLNTQSRMNPALLPLFEQDYAGADRPNQRSLQTREGILQSVACPQCMGSPFFWWSYGKNDGHERCVNGKISNDLEAKMAASYCYWLHSEGFTHKHVAILSPYRAQVDKIKEELNKFNCRLSEFAKLSVFTVDEFQGHEQDLVVLSLVRNNDKRNIGFLMDRTRQVVAVSRQKRALCIIGCHEHFKVFSDSWKKRIEMFAAHHVSKHLVIRGRELQRPEEVTELVRERLEQSGCCQQPLYHQPPTRHDDKCHADAEDHGSKPADAQTPTVDTQSPGSVHNTFITIQNAVVQDSSIQIGQSWAETKAETEAEMEETEDLPDGASKEKLLNKWNGQKLVIGSEWDRLKTSLCLIDCEGTGTGCIGKKKDKLYLLTCWHIFEEGSSDSTKDILQLASESTLQFFDVEVDASTLLLLNESPVGNKDWDLVALPIRKEGLPDSIHPVDLSAMNYIKNRGQPVQSWRDYYITIMGFPEDPSTEVPPLRVSIGKVKRAKVSGKPYLLYHDADTKPGSSGSPVIVAEQLQTPNGPRNGLAIIALHTEAAKKQSNIATLLTPLIDML